MRERHRQILDLIHGAAAPMSVSEVAQRLDVHPSTARFHLEALVGEGVLDRVSDHPTGPGRPPIGYRARPGLARGSVRHYRVLAEILLGNLRSTHDDPAAAAAAAGRVWGAHLVPRPPPFRAVDDATAGDHLMAMLDDLDFAPELDTDGEGRPRRIRLRHCPFRELADPHRDIVCPLHLGLMQGALEELAAPVTVSTLEPFAEPTACLAHLVATTPQPDQLT